jgi:DNA polymerase
MVINMDKNKEYEKLWLEMFKCEKCFSREDKLLLPGTGTLDTKVVAIGEAPSKHRTFNMTFGMKSKNIIDSFLSYCNLDREMIWITNCVKCIIPHKSVGNPDHCKDFLMRELDIIDPRVVILFGKTAVKTVLGKSYDFGKVIEALERKYVCIPHPATVLYGTYSMDQYLKFAEIVRKVIEDEI